ncbi:MAG: glycosyltransferase family 2 protein, partial [Candidatus Tectomicrobia bacterium]|nr:glycosyltransferase family 2 protein [Candidatus Tectomicrobia bacterium]
MKLISIVFSFRNEEEVIPELVSRVVQVMNREPEDYELIFINDDSSDNSLSVLLKEREKNPKLKIINMSRRFGVSECVFAGMMHTRGDAVIYMDADLQDPPELIPKLLENWRHGADVVHTVRTSRQGESRFKLLLTRLGYNIIGWGASLKLPVEAGDFKLLSRRVVDILLCLPESDPYLRGLVAWVGFTQAAVSYERDQRYAGRSHFPLLSR